MPDSPSHYTRADSPYPGYDRADSPYPHYDRDNYSGDIGVGLTREYTLDELFNMRFSVDERTQGARSIDKVQVIALGLPFCGTSSLEAAFRSEHIDCKPVMSMARVIPYPKVSQMILNAFREQDKAKRQAILHKLFDNYAAITDFPACVFAEDLLEMYPDARVILNMREAAAHWANDVHDALLFFGSPAYAISTIFCRADRLHIAMYKEAYALAERKLGPRKLGAPGGGPPKDTPLLATWYREYNDYIRITLRESGRPYLEWKPYYGWDYLCEFLGKVTPNDGLQPFLHINEKTQYQAMKRALVVRGLNRWVAALLFLGVLLVIGVGTWARVTGRLFWGH
ncbi:hypothetical protein F5Y18DRAFT_436830 [Xylariaceae sp. FL1019]|nr:hypothetical protein F5Y18DRAFT_436830 [Xylariaceae sp. FL1019]